MAGPQNGPPQQRMQNGGQPYGQPYGQTQQAPMWSSAAPTQPQFGNTGNPGAYTVGQPMGGSYNPSRVNTGMQQPTNTYNTTSSQSFYNQPMTQAPLAADTTPKPAMPATNDMTMATEGNKEQPMRVPTLNGAPVNEVAPAPNSNITNPLTAAQNQVQNPVAPPPQAYTPPPAATTRPSGEQAVNGIVPRPEGTPNYMIDHHANSTTNGGSSITGLLGDMQNEVQGTPDFTDYNLSPRAPVMNQGQQNLVNMGINPMIARLYGSRG